MSVMLRFLIKAAVALFLPAFAVANAVVTVGATGSDRDAAIDVALSKALVEALGSQVFSVTTMNGDQFHSMATAVTSGRVQSYELLEEREIFDGVHVRLEVTLAEKDIAGIVPQEIKTWDQRIEDVQSWDQAQQSVGEYRRLLDGFLAGPRHQLNAGYAIVLRSYDVSAVDTYQLKGHVYVDIIVNQSWWDTYYRLVRTLAPQGNQVIREGPLKVSNDTAAVDLVSSRRVDKSLRYDLAHPLPVRLSVGRNVANFILYKNSLLVSAQPMTEDSAQTGYQQSQATRGEISLTKGNVVGGDAKIDKRKSDLQCGSVGRGASAVYCGHRFTVKIPFEAANEAEVIEIMRRGVKAELSLYGHHVCEFDCHLLDDDHADDSDANGMLKEFLSRYVK
ncbi:hypothetical protein DET61_12420 [Marinobacter nauticus]|jgi:hypothetical protein|uniref:Uncharacterized protein n=1 Tax=Marinobacter nauticus TaxID=2743 RepID=A0A368X4B8_MARNT|nr:hypothetical protein [Marinobacter nauticus]RCW62549.1 hypothetical protein DET61_12420 [Marinobacter nauticus]